MVSTGKRDRNGREIMVGDVVRFKQYNHYWEKRVELWGERGFYPFIPDVSEKIGFYVEPSKCVVIS